MYFYIDNMWTTFGVTLEGTTLGTAVIDQMNCKFQLCS